MVRDLLTERLGVLVIGSRRVHRVGHPVLLGLAEMVHQQVAGNGRNPGDERAFRCVIARKRAVHLDENFLRQVLGVVGRAGEAIADVVYPTVIGLHNLLPGGGIAGDTTPDQHRDDLDVFHVRSPEKVRLLN